MTYYFLTIAYTKLICKLTSFKSETYKRGAQIVFNKESITKETKLSMSRSLTGKTNDALRKRT